MTGGGEIIGAWGWFLRMPCSSWVAIGQRIIDWTQRSFEVSHGFVLYYSHRMVSEYLTCTTSTVVSGWVGGWPFGGASDWAVS